MFDLSAKSAIVTGAAKGIGKGIAQALLQSGAHVLIADLDEKECEAACRELAAAPGAQGRVSWVRCDVTRREQVEAMVDACVQRHGSIDILVNNAGIFPFKAFMDMAPADWDKVIEVDLKGVFHCSQTAARRMVSQKKGGRIVNIASIASIVAFPGLAHYCTAKSGLLGFTRTLAVELAPHKITVNAIGPGAIDTPGAHISDPAQRAGLEQKIPLGRIGQPADIAAAAVYLCSDEASYMTGQSLFVDGGWTLQ